MAIFRRCVGTCSVRCPYNTHVRHKNRLYRCILPSYQLSLTNTIKWYSKTHKGSFPHPSPFRIRSFSSWSFGYQHSLYHYGRKATHCVINGPHPFSLFGLIICKHPLCHICPIFMDSLLNDGLAWLLHVKRPTINCISLSTRSDLAPLV